MTAATSVGEALDFWSTISIDLLCSLQKSKMRLLTALPNDIDIT
jgi:hypothetical protein